MTLSAAHFKFNEAECDSIFDLRLFLSDSHPPSDGFRHHYFRPTIPLIV